MANAKKGTEPILMEMNFQRIDSLPGDLTLTFHDPAKPPPPNALHYFIPHPDFVKAPCLPPSQPISVIPTIGLITCVWGDYELVFDKFLAGLVATNGGTDYTWLRSTYKNRQKLFRDQIKAAIPNNPSLKSYLLKVVNESTVLHQDRNRITHGMSWTLVTSTGETSPPIVELATATFEQGKTIQKNFTVAMLAEIAYKIMHLSGRIKTFSRQVVEAPSLSPDDKSCALAIWDKGQAILPVYGIP